MSVVYVLISPESDRRADIQYDRFPLHACDQDMRVRRDSQVLQWRRPSKLDSWCLPGSEVFQSLICVVFLVSSFLWLENGKWPVATTSDVWWSLESHGNLDLTY